MSLDQEAVGLPLDENSINLFDMHKDVWKKLVSVRINTSTPFLLKQDFNKFDIYWNQVKRGESAQVCTLQFIWTIKVLAWKNTK